MQNFFGQDAVVIVARILAFATAIPFHEAAHAYVSDKLGDHTARDLGRLTLNPIKHLDPWGLLAMLTIGVGWAKPVPVNPANYKNKRLGMAMTALAGPVSNLLLAYVNLILYKVLSHGAVLWALRAGASEIPAWMNWVLTIFYFLSIININLAVFNMLPIPPFDGSRVFGLVLPERLYFKVMKYERFIMIGVILLMWSGAFGGLLGTLNGWVMGGFDWGTGWVDWIFAQIMPGLVRM